MVVYIKVNFWSTAQGIRVIEPWLQIRFFCLMNLKNPIEEKYFLLPTSISACLIKRRANLCHTEQTNDSAKETSSSLFKSANSVGWISRMEHFCSSDFREEEDRIERYVHTKTRKELISKCEHVLIREHCEMMWGAFKFCSTFIRMRTCGACMLCSHVSWKAWSHCERYESHVRRARLSAIKYPYSPPHWHPKKESHYKSQLIRLELFKIHEVEKFLSKYEY